MVDLTLPDAEPPPPPGPPPEAPAVPAADDGVATERLIARVRAWQHRHPLARRIGAREVVGIGVIALPYGPGDGTAPGAPGAMRPLYHQPKLLPGLSHRALVAFAERHAVRQRPGSPAWPQRDIERADAAPEPAPETRYLLTAAIEGALPRAGAATARRLLLAPEGPAIWGRRPLSRTMLAAAGIALVAVLGAGGWLLRAALTATPVLAPAPAATPAPLPASAPASAASAVPVVATASAPAAASAAASVATVLPAPTAPAPSAPATATSGAAHGAAQAPAASAPARAASAPPAAAMAASVAASVAVPPPEPVPPPKLLPMPGGRLRAEAASAPASASTAHAVAPGPHYALVSSPEKKRAAAEATLQRVHHLLGPAIGNLQAQVMPAPGGFVVTLWPLPTQADAEQLAAVLARRGVPMKWMEF